MYPISKILAGLTSITVLLACTPDKSSVPVARPATFKTWGKDFVIQPIAEADPKSQEFGHAVAQVRYASGGSGTGFFISADGLFLTNEHILPRERCSENGCSGVQIIRHLAEDGEIEIYSKFTILLQSKELDLAIAKVELPRDKSVPYLKLNARSLEDRADVNLVVLGHPAGSTLRATAVDYKGANRDELLLAGPVFWGNSGSPVIDLKSAQVVGVVSKLDLSTNNIDREGNISIPIRAVQSASAIKAMLSVFPSANSSDLKAGAFSPALRSLQAQKSLLPKKTEAYFAKPEVTAELFVSQYFGTANETAGLQKLFDSLKSLYLSYEAYEEALLTLNSVSLRSGRALKFSAEQAMDMTSALARADERVESYDRIGAGLLFDVMCGRSTPQACVSSALVRQDPYLASAYCRSPQSFGGADVMSYLSGVKSHALDPANHAYQRRLRFFFRTVHQRLDVGPLADTDLAEALEYLARVARDANVVSSAFRAETTHALLKKNPALVGRNSFQAAFMQ